MTIKSRRTDILIYGINFGPELTGVGRYSGELAFGLAARGYCVEAVTAPPHYPGWRVEAPYSAWRYMHEDLQGVRISRAPIVLYKAGAGVWRLIAPLSFAISSAPLAFWRILRTRPCGVICVEPTLLASPAALIAAKLVGARTLLHIQDLEVDAAFAVGHLKSGGIISRLAFCFERAVLSAFDNVVTISQHMARRLEAKGVSNDKLAVVRNWVDTSKIKPLERPSKYRQELGFSDDDFIVLYSGQIGPKQALHVVFEAARSLAKSSESTGQKKGTRRIMFVVAGEGPLKKAFAERYEHLPNLKLVGLQPEERLNEFLNLADCHILPQDPGVKDLVLPSKLGGMLASGKKILVLADDGSEVATFLGNSCVRLPPAKADLLPCALTTLAEEVSDDRQVERIALCDQLSPASAMDEFIRILLGEGKS